MATIELGRLPQQMAALERANAVRIPAAALKAELRQGLISFSEAVHDERADSLTLMALLMAQPRWGRERAARLLARERLPETKRVGSLTARQRRVLAEACRGR